MRRIPITPGQRSSTRRAVLGGKEFSLDLRWSDFEGHFYLTIRGADGAVVLANVRVVSLSPLLVGPTGSLWVYDPSPTPSDPTLTSLGDTHQLVFVPSTEAA